MYSLPVTNDEVGARISSRSSSASRLRSLDEVSARLLSLTVGLAGVCTALLLLSTGLEQAQSAGDVNCSDFPDQGAAQSYFIQHGGPGSDPAGLDDDGVACESLPCPCSSATGGGGGGGGKPTQPHCRRPGNDIRITFSKSSYPNIISHIKYSWRVGYPKRLVIWRKGADQRRDRLLPGIPTKPGFESRRGPGRGAEKEGSGRRPLCPFGRQASGSVQALQP